LLSALACLSLGTQAQTSLPAPSADGNAEVMLAPVTVQDSLAGETATGPVSGFVARRAISATKTDTPLIETPQSISVVTRDQFEAQGVTTLRNHTLHGGHQLQLFRQPRGLFQGPRRRCQSVPGRAAAHLRHLQQHQGRALHAGARGILRGPSSVLYGQGSVGGVLNLTSKRPQAERMREVQIQLGSHGRKQIASDMTGAMDDEGKWLYRLVAVGRDSNTQVDHVKDDRVVIAPSLTYRPSTDTR
jgi:iron complex outermembrane receptor protein